MAQRLEGYLWRKSGNDPAAYADKDTLKVRLKNLAMAMGKSNRTPGQQGQQQQQQQQVVQQQQGTPQQQQRVSYECCCYDRWRIVHNLLMLLW